MLDALTTADALAAGFADLDELLRVLSGGASRGPRGGKHHPQHSRCPLIAGSEQKR